jgi:hypothetical protein
MSDVPKKLAWYMFFTVAVIVITCCAIIGLKAQRDSSSGSKSAVSGTGADWSIHREDLAVVAALRILGIPENRATACSAELITVAEDNTPFLSDQIVGRTIWKVVVESGRLQLESALPGFEDAFERVFDVLVDPENGIILKIVSRWPDGIPEIAPEPPSWSAEEQMRRSGLEVYHGFPAEKPKISFLEALDIVLTQGTGSPLVAKQISAHYVIQSKMGREARPVWAINLRGIPPLEVGGGPGMAEETRRRAVPVEARNHIRNIVDARSGKWLSASTSPQPIVARSVPQLRVPPPPITSPVPTVTLDLISSSDGSTVAPGELVQWTITATVSVGDNPHRKTRHLAAPFRANAVHTALAGLASRTAPPRAGSLSNGIGGSC